MKSKLSRALPLVLLALLALPGTAFGFDAEAAAAGDFSGIQLELDILWIIIGTILVFLMQAGFMFLEVGFSRQKNAGTGVAKIFLNLAVITIAWWAVGFGINGPGNDFIGTEGFFYHIGQTIDGTVQGSGEASNMVFGLAFAAVSLAIVWGTTLERIKFSAYVIFAAIFGAIIYPLIAHGVWGGGLLGDIGGKPVLDFAGSSVVHLTGATAGLAALLLLGPRLGKYGADGKPRAIPGHSMPLVGLGVIILWIGWFGFNGASTFSTEGAFFGEVILATQLAAAAGVLGAIIAVYAKTKAIDVGMASNGAIGGLVGITAGAGFVEFWAAIIIGFIGGLIVVFGVLAIEKYIDDPVGALSAHGLAGIWGTFAVGIFGAERLIEAPASPGIWYGLFGDTDLGSAFGQLGVQTVGFTATFVVVLALSLLSFALIKATLGLRVSEQEEIAGLDIATHGMYGYPESFIPESEYPGGLGLPSPSGAAPTTLNANDESSTKGVIS